MKKEGKMLKRKRRTIGFKGKNLEGTHDKDHEWDQMVETDKVQGPVEKVARIEIMKAMQKMKSGKTTRPCGVSERR